MDLDDTPEQAAYRTRVQTWLSEHKAQAPVIGDPTHPNALKDEAEIIAARRAWQGKLAEAGLAGVTWPQEYGGQGLGPIAVSYTHLVGAVTVRNLSRHGGSLPGGVFLAGVLLLLAQGMYLSLIHI